MIRRRERDEIRADKGSGLLSPRAERELREFDDAAHPRFSLSPDVELELAAERVSLADDDEKARCCGVPHRAADPDEPACDRHGRPFDLMGSTPPVGVELGPTDRDIFSEPLFDDLAAVGGGLGVEDEIATFDIL